MPARGYQSALLRHWGSTEGGGAMIRPGAGRSRRCPRDGHRRGCNPGRRCPPDRPRRQACNKLASQPCSAEQAVCQALVARRVRAVYPMPVHALVARMQRSPRQPPNAASEASSNRRARSRKSPGPMAVASLNPWAAGAPRTSAPSPRYPPVAAPAAAPCPALAPPAPAPRTPPPPLHHPAARRSALVQATADCSAPIPRIPRWQAPPPVHTARSATCATSRAAAAPPARRARHHRRDIQRDRCARDARTRNKATAVPPCVRRYLHRSAGSPPRDRRTPLTRPAAQRRFRFAP
jgi:hypothetical protein